MGLDPLKQNWAHIETLVVIFLIVWLVVDLLHARYKNPKDIKLDNLCTLKQNINSD